MGRVLSNKKAVFVLYVFIMSLMLLSCKQINYKEKLSEVKVFAEESNSGKVKDDEVGRGWKAKLKIEQLAESVLRSKDEETKIYILYECIKLMQDLIQDDFSQQFIQQDEQRLKVKLFFLLVEYSKKRKTDLNALLKKYDVNCIEVDLDGDGIKEFIMDGNVDESKGNAFAYRVKDNKIFNFGDTDGNTGLQKILNFNNSNKQVAVLWTGFRAGRLFMVGINDNEFYIRNIPEDYKDIDEVSSDLIDINNDGLKEIVVFRKFGYVKCSWPEILEWDGEKLVDISERYPDVLIKDYKYVLNCMEVWKNHIEDAESKTKFINYLKTKYPKIWQEYLQPLNL